MNRARKRRFRLAGNFLENRPDDVDEGCFRVTRERFRVVNVKEMDEWRKTRNKRCRSLGERIKERNAGHPNIEPTKRQPVRGRREGKMDRKEKRKKKNANTCSLSLHGKGIQRNFYGFPVVGFPSAHFPVKRTAVPAPILDISCNYGCFDVDELSKRFKGIGKVFMTSSLPRLSG